MGAQELRLNSALSTLRVNDLQDNSGHIVIHVDAGLNTLSATLDRNQQHLLFLYLKERLES